jgi:GT2 family glycosyltransferase
MPVVSMIIATYNKPRETVATVHNLLIQTLQDFELIVVNDGPGAAVRDAVCTIGDPRILYHETQERYNDWGNSSKELGSRLARGTYIGHSNDDNYYAPIYFMSMVRALSESGAGFAYCNMIHSHQDYRPFDTNPTAGWIDGGGWLCKAEIVKNTPWPEPKSDQYADGRYVEALVSRAGGTIKVPGYLFVHN